MKDALTARHPQSVQAVPQKKGVRFAPFPPDNSRGPVSSDDVDAIEKVSRQL
jgi:hypothetical protein